MNWITDRAPCKSGRYLIYVNYKSIANAVLIGDWAYEYNSPWSWCTDGVMYSNDENYKVMAWAELPDAPILESEE